MLTKSFRRWELASIFLQKALHFYNVEITRIILYLRILTTWLHLFVFNYEIYNLVVSILNYKHYTTSHVYTNISFHNLIDWSTNDFIEQPSIWRKKPCSTVFLTNRPLDQSSVISRPLTNRWSKRPRTGFKFIVANLGLHSHILQQSFVRLFSLWEQHMVADL